MGAHQGYLSNRDPCALVSTRIIASCAHAAEAGSGAATRRTPPAAAPPPSSRAASCSPPAPAHLHQPRARRRRPQQPCVETGWAGLVLVSRTAGAASRWGTDGEAGTFCHHVLPASPPVPVRPLSQWAHWLSRSNSGELTAKRGARGGKMFRKRAASLLLSGTHHPLAPCWLRANPLSGHHP